jgi:hypothetical protein
VSADAVSNVPCHLTAAQHLLHCVVFHLETSMKFRELLADEVADRLLQAQGLPNVPRGLALLDPDLVALDHGGAILVHSARCRSSNLRRYALDPEFSAARKAR